MKKFTETLTKRAETTPHNCQKCEMLRSKFGLPYLVKQYNYDCFKTAQSQLQKQYDAMPDLCKGFFTLDDNGVQVALLSNEIVRERLDALYAGQNKSR